VSCSRSVRNFPVTALQADRRSSYRWTLDEVRFIRVFVFLFDDPLGVIFYRNRPNVVFEHKSPGNGTNIILPNYLQGDIFKSSK